MIDKANYSEKKNHALIMKGGGIKGLAYVGALEVLERYFNFNWFAGTSAGGVSAILLAAGYTSAELKQILENKDFTDFKDAGIIKMVFNFIFKNGLYEAKTFTDWIDRLLAEKLESPTEVLMHSLPFRATLYASKRGSKAFVFDSSYPESKKVRAAFAARCSMAIPYIFTPESSEGKRVFDGGAQNNYPVQELLSDNPKTNFIGLYLGSETFQGLKKTSVLKDLLAIWTESNDEEALIRYKDDTVIIDPSPISTLDFSLTEEEKTFLLDCGRLSALRFLNKRGVLKEKIDLSEQKSKLEKTREKLRYVRQKKKRKKRILKFGAITLITIIALLLSFFSGKISLSEKINGKLGYMQNGEQVPIQEALIELRNGNGELMQKHPIVKSLTNGKWTIYTKKRLCDECYLQVLSEDCPTEKKFYIHELRKKSTTNQLYNLLLQCNYTE
ncbi:MAG: patatin-like phospholipase family protein [Bacteroidota bacterium]